MRLLIIILFLSSCSANWHLNKAVKKGAKLKTIETIKHDTTYFTDHYYQVDTVFNKETLVEYVPQTKWKTRIEYKYLYKLNRDSLKHVQKLYRDSIQVEKKKLSNERNKNNRLNRFMWWLMVFFIIILLLYIVGRIVASKLLK